MSSPSVVLELRGPSVRHTRASGVVQPSDATLAPDPVGEAFGELDGRLAALCRERGALRAVLARITSRLVFVRAWERIGYARLSDYAVEQLGLAGRSVRSLAEVGARLRERPSLEQALVSGTLGWTKVRLLARLPSGEDEARWIDHARHLTAEELSRAVRAVDRGSIEAGAVEDGSSRSRLFEVRCTPEVRWKWLVARSAAARAAGRALAAGEAAELIAAEVLSALPIAEGVEDAACEETGVSWSESSESTPDGPTPGAAPVQAFERLPWGATRARGDEVDPALPGLTLSRPGLLPSRPGLLPSRPGLPPSRPGLPPSRPGLPPSRPSLPPALETLLEGLDEQDAFALDERLRRALSLAQRLDARIGALLAPLWSRFLHRALGYASREAYARERLGMDPTRARALVRLERAALASAPFARAYRMGSLSWVKAAVLIPMVSADPLGCFMEDWVAWARRVTVRRLREDVELALALAETDPVAFRCDGGLPAEARGKARDEGEVRDEREIGAAARSLSEPVISGDMTGGDVSAAGDREIGAPARSDEEDAWAATIAATRLTERGSGAGGREIGAAAREDGLHSHHPEPLKSAPDEVCWARFFGPPDVVQLFRAVLCTVRRRIEQETGRLPTAGAALGVMLDHVLSSWRCAVPGCTSLQNLHDHHVRFRSAGGGDALDNRITLCAFHHLRGVHAGLLRCVGRAPDGLRWEMGIRPGVTPLLAYRSGDIRLTA